MPRQIRNLTVTLDGDERDATWKEGVGIYVSGHDFGKGDTVEIEGTPHEVPKMRRMQMQGETVTLLVKVREFGSQRSAPVRPLSPGFEKRS